MRLLITGGSGFIGTNLVRYHLDKGTELINLDWNPPLDESQRPWWREWNIMDVTATRALLAEFRPTHVVHLAARADTDEKEDINAYIQNHEGTRRFLAALKEVPSVEHVIVTSTQFVCEAGYQPRHDQDYKPFTLYGETKRLTEVATREAGLPFAWTIIRPTTIWGPWSLRYRDVMFRIMRMGLYFHPTRQPVIRSYGYVGNVVWQIDRMLQAPRQQVDGKVFYVGDPPFDLKVWVDAISRELVGRPVRFIPAWIIKGVALVGDALKMAHVPFPITTGRFQSMTRDYVTPMDRTIDAFGTPPYGMAAGVKGIVAWYRNGSERIKAHTLKDVRQLQNAR